MNIEKIHNTTVNLPDREVKPGEVISNVQICPPSRIRQHSSAAEPPTTSYTLPFVWSTKNLAATFYL